MSKPTLPHGLRDHDIVPDTIKNTFNFDIESIDKTCSIVKNVGRTLGMKNMLMIG